MSKNCSSVPGKKQAGADWQIPVTEPGDSQSANKSPRRFAISRGVLLEVAVVIIALLVFYNFQARGLLATDGQQAPGLVLRTLDGQDYDLGSDANRPTLVYFFAPWCKICAASSGNVNRLRKWTDDNKLNVVMVALDWQSIDEVSEYAAKHSLIVPILLGDKDTAHDWQIYAYPSYYLLDRRHRIVHSDLGYSTLFGLWWRSWLTT